MWRKIRCSSRGVGRRKEAPLKKKMKKGNERKKRTRNRMKKKKKNRINEIARNAGKGVRGKYSGDNDSKTIAKWSFQVSRHCSVLIMSHQSPYLLF